MNESFLINLGGMDIYSGEHVRRGRNRVIFRRVVIDIEGDYVEVADFNGKTHKCNPAELRRV